MKNVFIKAAKPVTHLDKDIRLSNGTLVVVKKNEEIFGVYLVISFRDHKDRYRGQKTQEYCSLINLDSGQFVFEERCSRKTTVRRVLNHILRLGYDMPYDPNNKTNDSKMCEYNIEICSIGNYIMEINLNNIEK